MATRILKSQSDAAKTTSNTLYTSDFHFHKNLIVLKLNLNKNLVIEGNADGVAKQAFVYYVTIVQQFNTKIKFQQIKINVDQQKSFL